MKRSGAPYRYRPWAVLVLLLPLAGCHSWEPVTASPREWVEREQPERIRVTHVEGWRIDVRDPFVKGDSLTATFSAAQDVSFAFTDVLSVEARRTSMIRTGILSVILVPAAVFAAKSVLCLLPHYCTTSKD